MIIIVSSDWFTELRVIFVPPRLASALAGSSGSICGYAIPGGVAGSACFLGFGRRGAFAKPVSPAEGTQGVILGWRADLKGEVPAAPWLRLSCVAKSVWDTLSIFLTCLILLLLSSAILHPINVFSSCRIGWAIIAEMRTVEVCVACQVLVVRLQWLAFSTKAALKTVDAILVVPAGHAHLVPISTHPIRPLIRWLWLPPDRQAQV